MKYALRCKKNTPFLFSLGALRIPPSVEFTSWNNTPRSTFRVTKIGQPRYELGYQSREPQIRTGLSKSEEERKVKRKPLHWLCIQSQKTEKNEHTTKHTRNRQEKSPGKTQSYTKNPPLPEPASVFSVPALACYCETFAHKTPSRAFFSPECSRKKDINSSMESPMRELSNEH